MIYFATFGNGSFSKSRERIVNEAKQMEVFENIFAYGDIGEEYKKLHGDFIFQNKKGFGCWIWKPWVVIKTLEKLNDEDILLYCDAGCSLYKEGINRFFEYIEMVKNRDSGILCFQLKDMIQGQPLHPEKRWNKRDTIEAVLGENPSDDILNSSQCEAGMIFVRKCESSLKIIKEWYDLCQNHHLISDSPSLKKNDPIFKEHRHDQSIFSLVVKKNKGLFILDETYWYPNWDDYRYYPIHATRIRN